MIRRFMVKLACLGKKYQHLQIPLIPILGVYFIITKTYKYCIKPIEQRATWKRAVAYLLILIIVTTNINVLNVRADDIRNSISDELIELATDEIKPDETQTCTITFEINDGSSDGIDSKQVDKGSEFGNNKIPFREYYLFLGWFDEKDEGQEITADTIINDNITVYAHWKKIANDEDMNNPKVFFIYGDNEDLYYVKITLSEYILNTTDPLEIMIEGDGKGGGNWIADNTYILFEATEDNTCNEKIEVDKFETSSPGVLKATVEINNTAYGKFQMISGLFSSESGSPLVCSYTEGEEMFEVVNNNFIVSYNPNGGSVSTSQKLVDKNGVYGELPIPTREGYTFEGWYTSAEEGNKITSDLICSSNIILYAHWTKNQENNNAPTYNYSSSDSELVNSINNVEDDAKITIDYSSSDIIDSSIFNAIKGTNKSVILEKNNTKWKFSGNRLNGDIKDIDISISADILAHNGSIYLNMISSRPSVILTFANNGILPGTATVSIKLENSMVDYLGRNNLVLYYYNSAVDKIELVASGLNVSEDGYLSFDIDHCSQYLISKGNDSNNTNPPSDILESDSKNNSSLNESSEDTDIIKSVKTKPEVNNAELDYSQPILVNANDGWTYINQVIETRLNLPSEETYKVINIKMGNIKTVPADTLKLIAGEKAIICLFLENGVAVAIHGEELDRKLVTDFTATSTENEDGTKGILVLTEYTDVKKYIVIFVYQDGKEIGMMTELVFLQDGILSLIMARSQVYFNGYAAYIVPLASANYQA